jgi:hypothetical protein
MGLALLALSALGFAAASSASAALPEFYECKKVTVKYSGVWNKGCLVEGKHNNSLKENEYEKVSGIGKAATKLFKGKGGTATLHTPAVGGEVVCKAFSDSGYINGEKSMRDVVSVFTGCVSLGKKCTSAGETKVGAIKTDALAGEVGYISAAEHTVGVVLSPEGTELASFNCEGLTVAVSGAVIGQLTAVNTMSKDLTTTFTVTGGGLQTYTKLEGGSTEVLESLIDGSGPFESGQQASALNAGETLELRA